MRLPQTKKEMDGLIPIYLCVVGDESQDPPKLKIFASKPDGEKIEFTESEMGSCSIINAGIPTPLGILPSKINLAILGPIPNPTRIFRLLEYSVHTTEIDAICWMSNRIG